MRPQPTTDVDFIKRVWLSLLMGGHLDDKSWITVKGDWSCPPTKWNYLQDFLV